MWNTEYTLPTMVLLLIITGAFLGRKRLPVRVNFVFAGLLWTDFLTMIADYTSVKMDEAGGLFPDWVLWIVNYLFFGLFLARSFYFFLFAVELLDSPDKRRLERPFEVIFIGEQAFLLLGSLTGWIFTIQAGVYHSGPMYEFINLQFAGWIFAGLAVTALTEKPLHMRKGGIYLYLLLLLCGVIVRTLLPHVVVMNLFCLFAIQVIYLLYLNPDQYIDNVTFLFNHNGWNRVLSESSLEKDFRMVGFGIRDFEGLRQLRGGQRVSEGLEEIGSWISHQWPKLACFYLGNGIFVLSSRQNFDQHAVMDEISRRFDQPWSAESGEFYVRVNEMIMDRGVHAPDNDVLRGALRGASHRLNRPEEAALTHIDDSLLKAYIREGEVHKILQRALTNNALCMFLQPVVNTETGAVEGAEALCRLKDGDGRYIFPDEFIPLAMNNGSMDILGHQMFRKACAFMSREDVKKSGIQWVNVNVAPEQFRNPNLLEEFLGILGEYGLTPSKIHLEITEESMIDRTLLHDSMAKFRKKGFIFSMDDFGSSYSNMIRLQQNHFSNVKIDKDFTWSYFRHKTALLPDIILTCHDLGMKVVVEGVETKEMADGIREIHGDYIQGYYYSKPIPEEEFVRKYYDSSISETAEER